MVPTLAERPHPGVPGMHAVLRHRPGATSSCSPTRIRSRGRPGRDRGFFHWLGERDRRGPAPRTKTSSSGSAALPGRRGRSRAGRALRRRADRRALPERADPIPVFGPPDRSRWHAARVGRQSAALRRLAVPAAGGGLGYVPEDKVIGQAFVIIWPFVARGVAALRSPTTSIATSVSLRAQGFSRIAGADEAGRGALAGPLVAAAVILPVGFDRGDRRFEDAQSQPARGGLRASGGRRRLRRGQGRARP